MPYQTRNDLPKPVQRALRDVPHAQDVYKEAYNSAYQTYAEPTDRRAGYDQEETAHAVAWQAVKQSYSKTSDGEWRKK